MGKMKALLIDQQESDEPLTQEELLWWWPFTRLDPKRFPKPEQPEPHDDYEEAPF
jgi:hypothetical protein